MDPFFVPMAVVVPSGEIAIETGSSGRATGSPGVGPFRSQIFTERYPPDARIPSGLNASDWTASL